jgi:membrane-bound lytic murein transglycosylase D
VVARRAEQRARAQKAAAAAAAAAAQSAQSAALPDELPEARLTTDDETLRALLAQVHGRGKESAELKALVDEQAALAARALKKGKCEGSSAECQQWAKIRQTVLGQGATKRIRRRAAGSPDRLQSRWLVGLKMPEIAIEDDPLVQRALEYYTDKPVGRESFQGMLFRCGRYRELIESTLIRYDLPIDLLAVVFTESGCQPQAVSPVGAAGLWQFMPTTARAYHLRVKEGVIDERRSPPKSTEAAVRFLRDLRDKFLSYDRSGVWDLVFGSYNMGPFGMAARIERAGGDVGFWDLVAADLLPDETTHYAPTIQAMALILNNLQRFKFATVQVRAPELTSDLQVPPGTRLSLIARAASTSTRRVRSMNLDISSGVTPAFKKFAVQVPKDVVFQARDTLTALIASGDRSDLCVPPDFDWGRKQFTKKMAKACERKLKARKAPAKP